MFIRIATLTGNIPCTGNSHYLNFAFLKWPFISKWKIWSLFKHENLTTGNKILWKRGEIAPQEQFLLFSTIFSIYLLLQESNYIFVCEMWLFDLFFSQFCKSDMSRYGYLEVLQRVPWTLIMRVGCILNSTLRYGYLEVLQRVPWTLR